MRNTMMIGLAMLTMPAYAGEMNSAWAALNFTTFNELTTKMHIDSVAGLSLVDVKKLLAEGAEVDDSRIHEEMSYQLILSASSVKNTASLIFYWPDAGYEKLGINYGQAHGLLEARASQLGLSKVVRSTDLINGDDIEESSVGRSVWKWQSNGFSCRLLIDNATYFGGDILYECRM